MMHFCPDDQGALQNELLDSFEFDVRKDWPVAIDDLSDIFVSHGSYDGSERFDCALSILNDDRY